MDFIKQRSYLGGLIRTETCMHGDNLYKNFEVGADTFGFSIYRAEDLETRIKAPAYLTISYGSQHTWIFQIYE